MLIDMNADGTLAAETIAPCDWPFASPVRSPVRDEVNIRGSVTGGVTLAGQGTPDGATPSPPDRYPLT